MVVKAGMEDDQFGEAPLVLPPMEEGEVREVERILGYEFMNKRLLEEALTHGSYYPPKPLGPSYERLEFVGDAVLSCVMAREVFSSYPDLLPGRLTLLRAANIDTERLARIALTSSLHLYLRHKAPQLDRQIEEFIDGINEHPYHSNGLLDPPKPLADIIESVIGAIFMDSSSSLETAWKVFVRLADPFINENTLGRHPVSELHELCQKMKRELKFVKNKWEENTTVKVLVDNELYGIASYSYKKEIAQNRAAKAALNKLKKELEDMAD
ncbi:Ribonuclease 3-like protein 3 [Apostasia shenzhenica]|uniref:Ribonuclease 3-like protein 3 n=1 Tax=Apostasia shenzhenica TaxID=1088818 RepID=A0A2I0B3V7_9ASPA|nr:Ribonuclease 3-like protein 3 [Apostasia shenzhenica]